MVSLAGLQAINFLLTLSILPFLTRTLGIEAFGEVVFAQLLINYAMWVVNWGFYLGATQRVSASRHDPVSVSIIFSATWIAQFWLTLLVVVIFISSVLIIPRFDGLHLLYFAGLSLIAGNTLLPIWFLNGMERIKLAALLQIGSKIFAIPITLWLVRGPETGWIYIASLGFSMLLMACIACWVIFGKLQVRFIRPSFRETFSALKGDFALFISAIFANMNATIVPATLGSAVSPEVLAHYNLADRARSAALSILTPVTHALFPRMCYLFASDRSGASKLLFITGAILFVSALLLALILFVFSDTIVYFLGGEAFSLSGDILKLLSLSPIFAMMASFAIHQILIPIGHYNVYPKATMFALAISVVLVLPTVKLFGAPGGALVSLASEAVLMLTLWCYLLRKKSVSEKFNS